MQLIAETSVFDDERLGFDVNQAQETASSALDIAGNNEQYFWHTESGTDTGVHITLTPQDTFKRNPTGYNLLARNNGVEVREGLTPCSVFTNSGTYFNAVINGTNQLITKYEITGAQIGAELAGYRNITIDNTNGIRFRNGTVNLAHYNIGSIVFYDGDTPTNHELMNLGMTGLVLKDNTGLQYASFGGNAIIGRTARGYSRTTITDGGMEVLRRPDNSDTDIVLAHIGYDTGQDSSGGTSSSSYPYYTFGTRYADTTSTRGNYSFAQGYSVIAQGYASHAEGTLTTASESWSHAEGRYTTASGRGAHTEGDSTEAIGSYSHAEGTETQVTSTGTYGHAEGANTKVIGVAAHAEGTYTEAHGYASHASGDHTKATGDAQTVVGQYNVADTNMLFIVGNGTDDLNRRNGFTVNKNGVAAFGAPANTFRVTTETLFSTTMNAGTAQNSSKLISNSGFYPIGVVGWQTGSGDINAADLYLDAQTAGSATLYYIFKNVGSTDRSVTAQVDILWVKITS